MNNFGPMTDRYTTPEMTDAECAETLADLLKAREAKYGQQHTAKHRRQLEAIRRAIAALTANGGAK